MPIRNQRSAKKDSLWKLNTLILILILYHFEKFYQTDGDQKRTVKLLSQLLIRKKLVRERRWMAMIKLKFLRRVLVTAIPAWLTFWWYLWSHSVFECFETAKQKTCKRRSRFLSDILNIGWSENINILSYTCRISQCLHSIFYLIILGISDRKRLLK